MAEWQTRTVQVRVSVRTWGFNSPLAHHRDPQALACSVQDRDSANRLLTIPLSALAQRLSLIGFVLVEQTERGVLVQKSCSNDICTSPPVSLFPHHVFRVDRPLCQNFCSPQARK